MGTSLNAVSLPLAARPRLYLLAEAPQGIANSPAVIFLHGTGGSAGWVDSETYLVSFAAKQGFTVAFPDGLPPQPDRPPGFLSNPQRWNDGSAKPGDALYSAADDVGFLEAVIQDLVRRGVDAKRISLWGFSNGAGMAFRFAAERPGLLSALACVAGHCWIEPAPFAPPVHTLFMLGDADPLFPPWGGDVMHPWRKTIYPCPAYTRTRERWVQAMGHEDYWQEMIMPGLGHHWPGGAGQLNPRIGGPKASDVNANEVIWDFVKKFNS